MNKTTVIFHSADFDGIFCREIAKKFLGTENVEYIGWNFGDAPLPIPEGQIYVMDLPVDRVFFKDAPALATDNGELCFLHSNPPPTRIPLSRIVWIDHHKSSIETHPESIPGYRIDGVAACRLAWQWFAYAHGQLSSNGFVSPAMGEWPLPKKQEFIDRDVPEPLAVRLAGEYDIWDRRDPRAELFQHGLRSRELDDVDWHYLLLVWTDLSITRDVTSELLEGGKVLQYARANEYRDVITSQGFDIEFEGLKFLACCSHEADIRSHLFEAGIKPHHDALFGFTYTGKEWRVSMYHAPGKEHHDLSVIAKKYGGGGHRGACGMMLKTLRFLPDAETHVMQLAAISTASIQNTDSTVKDRIPRDNPYWTQAYEDVCVAVNREMMHRKNLQATREMISRFLVAHRDTSRSWIEEFVKLDAIKVDWNYHPLYPYIEPNLP